MRTHPFLFTIFFLFCSSLSAATYYWVGGTGNWSDISHWATTSGGGITHAQAPTAEDDVIFDFNSFTAPGQTVTMNITVNFCRSMTWIGVTNNPNLVAGPDVQLNIFGSLALDPNMTFAFEGRTTFTGDLTDNTVSFGTHNAGQDVSFDGTGNWTLTNGITVDSTFRLNEGNLITGNQNIDCKYFESKTDRTRTLDLGASVITIRGTTVDPFNGSVPDQIIQPLRLKATNMTMTPGNSLFILLDPIVDIWLEGPGVINFNRVILPSMTGNSRIIPYDALNDSNNFPTMNYVEMNLFHNTLLNGSPTVNNLLLHPGQRYQFESGQTFNFDYIEAFGSCLNVIALEGTDDGSPAIFNTDDNINVSFVNLRSINATGAGSFTADDAIDLGGNAGWTINPRSSTDFYWVGGTGNWNDPAHWSFTSGGPSSGCLPSALDDVFFDVNSFNGGGQIVTINVENAYCRSMDWTGATGNPVFAGPMENNMRLTGSLNFIPAMQHTFAGAYFFESTQMGNTITTAGQPFNFDLNFSGVNGEWILQDEIYVDWDIRLISGTLRTNDQIINTGGLFTELPLQRTFTLGNSYITIERRNNREATWDLNAENMTFDAGTSTIESTGTLSNLFRTYGVGDITYNNILFTCPEGRLFSLIDFPGNDVTIDSLLFQGEGFISGNNNVNYWYMAPGFRYDFVSDVRQTINELDANGNCADGFVYIRTSTLGYTTNFDIANDQTFQRVYLHGIQQLGTGQLTANNSLDGGGNSNWTFNASSGRTLYWVGDTGEWYDEANWSLGSGGPGGECVPTPLDNVIFDNNSFVTPNAEVMASTGRDAYCRDMTWTNGILATPNLIINGSNFLNVFGSLSLNADVTWGAPTVQFSGDGFHTIRSTGNQLSGIRFDGSGTYVLEDDLQAAIISHIRGTFETNSQTVNAEAYYANSIPNPKRLILGSTYMTLTSNNTSPFIKPFTVFSDGMVIEPGTSTIEILAPNTGLRADYALDFHNLLFTSTDGQVNVLAEDCTFNKITFNGGADIENALTTDTMLCAPGKQYIFDANFTQTINEYWQIIGNNCTPIELRSSILGILANVSMPANSSLLADFIQMRDMQGLGGGQFLAGARSTDIANSNVGWIFESAPDVTDVGFLGTDVALCSGEPAILDAFSFTNNETYVWQDGSTNATFTATQSGAYFVEVTFETNCIIRDTIDVLAAQDFQVNLMGDQSICNGETLTLSADVGINGASYTWQDASENPTLDVTTAGEYSVEVNIGGCTDRDTVQVAVDETPMLDLGDDITACTGDTPTLQSNVTAESYLWQDGSMMNSFMVTNAGLYWLEAANGNCASRDTIMVNYVQSGSINLGSDTLICGDLYRLTPGDLMGADYLWSDGSSDTFLDATTAGEYWVEVSIDGCTARDSVELDFQLDPPLDIPDEIFACEGELVEVNSPVMADSYLWSDGSMGTSFSTTTADTYSLEVTFGQCQVSKNFEVILQPVPTINDLGADQNLCEGDNLVLEAISNATNITWQDGSMNNSFSVTTAGEYFFVAESNGCTASDTINISVTDLPELDLGPDQTGCAGDAIVLSTTAIADQLSWQDGTLGNTFNVNSDGLYWLEASVGSCSIRDSVTINFIDAGSLNLGADTTLCDQSSFVISPNLAGAIYTWQDGSMDSSFEAVASGTYSVLAEVQGCSTRDTIELIFQDNPSLGLQMDYAICEGESLDLTIPATADAYEWSNGSTNNTFSTGNPGNYDVVAFFGSCLSQATFDVSVNSRPIIEDLGPDQSLCAGSTTTLLAQADIGSLSWQDGSTTSTFVVVEEGTYILTADNDGCISQDSVTISLIELPSLEVTGSYSLCDGEAITIGTDVTTADSLRWSTGDTSNSTIISAPGNYSLTAYLGVCEWMDNFVVENASTTVLSLGPDTIACDNQAFVLQPELGGGTILWPDGTSSVSYSVDKPELVIATLQANGCSSSDSVFVDFKECLTFKAFVPNIFSPNDDGSNDTFAPAFPPTVEILSYEFAIFDRWGAQLFATNNLTEGWDGYAKGSLANPGVYVYFINITYRDDLGENNEVIKGDVAIIR